MDIEEFIMDMQDDENVLRSMSSKEENAIVSLMRRFGQHEKKALKKQIIEEIENRVLKFKSERLESKMYQSGCDETEKDIIEIINNI